jgi:hypothetical protein
MEPHDFDPPGPLSEGDAIDHLWNAAPLHKSALGAIYRLLVESGEWDADEALLAAIARGRVAG